MEVTIPLGVPTPQGFGALGLWEGDIPASNSLDPGPHYGTTCQSGGCQDREVSSLQA